MPSVTVVIPNWNGSAMLEKLLGELRNQSVPIQRVIVVDNGSSDNSVLVANQAGAEVIELGRNTGFSHAVNAGIQSARTEWIAILNNDVSPKPDWLENLVEQAQATNSWFAAGKLLDALAPASYRGILRRHLPWRLRLEMRPRPFRFPALEPVPRDSVRSLHRGHFSPGTVPTGGVAR